MKTRGYVVDSMPHEQDGKHSVVWVVSRRKSDGSAEVVETYDNMAHADALAYTLNNFKHGEA